MPLTNIDETQVRSYVLPDPLRLANGEQVNDTNTWTNRRRPEILNLFAEHQHGFTPREPLVTVHVILDSGVVGLEGLARRTQARIHFSDAPQSPTIRVLHYTPRDARGPVPTLLHVGFCPPIRILNEPGLDVGKAWSGANRVPDYEAPRPACLPLSAMKHLVQRGYGIVYVYYEDIEPDFNGGAAYGVRALYEPQNRQRRASEWGAVGAWAWGISRVLDFLLTQPTVDAGRVALSGVSRLGKAVLWAGAQDERFAAVIAMLSGEGGDAVSRRNFGESIADLVAPERFPYWFAPRYAEYAQDVDSLPVDGHMLLALMAPRPLLQITGSEDHWADPKGEFLASLAAKPVYELFGKRGVDWLEFPAAGSRSLNDMGYFIHKGPHMTYLEDYAVLADFLDRHFRRAP